MRNATIEVLHDYLRNVARCKKWQKRKKGTGREAKAYKYLMGG